MIVCSVTLRDGDSEQLDGDSNKNMGATVLLGDMLLLGIPVWHSYCGRPYTISKYLVLIRVEKSVKLYVQVHESDAVTMIDPMG